MYILWNGFAKELAIRNFLQDKSLEHGGRFQRETIRLQQFR